MSDIKVVYFNFHEFLCTICALVKIIYFVVGWLENEQNYELKNQFKRTQFIMPNI
jgi:hypothetical protein